MNMAFLVNKFTLLFSRHLYDNIYYHMSMRLKLYEFYEKPPRKHTI